MTDDRFESVLALASALAGDPRHDAALEACVRSAQSAVVLRMFPYSPSATYADVPAKWDQRTADIAVLLLAKSGAEGESSHSENGTSRRWGSALIPPEYFAGMAPMCGVPS